MERDLYRLYYYPLNASMAPRFVMEAIGVEHDLILVDRKANAQKSPDYLALNPAGRIPVLVAEEAVVAESAAICIFLCECHPELGLIPGTIQKRAKFFQWLLYLTGTVQAELMIYFYPDRHAADSVASSEMKKVQNDRLAGMFSLLNEELQGKDFLLGEELSICDYFLFMLCVWADELSVPPLSFPDLKRYLAAMAKRSEIRRVCQHEGLDLAPYA
jgi:glutathione S-transferase|tara:strand:+ start:103 stop:750 length:648 start_codon:yes stop_codon:yes gene_type:complete